MKPTSTREEINKPIAQKFKELRQDWVTDILWMIYQHTQGIMLMY